MPGTTKKTYPDDSFEGGTPYQGRNHGHHSHNYCYPHPDSPSAFSQLTTATRRDEVQGEDDPNAAVIIRIVAPATLPEGYTMDVLYDDEPYTVEIPRGGVKEGEEFETVLDPTQKYKYHSTPGNSSRRMQMEQSIQEEGPDDSRMEEYSQAERSRRSGKSNYSGRSGKSNNISSDHRQLHHKANIYDSGSPFTANESQIEKEKADDSIQPSHTYPLEKEEANNEKDEKEEDTIWYDENGTPMGGWRTRLCSCCDVLTQSTFWMGFFCAPVLMAQIVNRLKLTWNGREGPPEETSLSFNRLVLSLVFTMAVFWVPVMGSLCLFAYYLVVIIYVGSQVRTYMRQRYKIPSTLPTRCGDRVDDVCMMLFCGCCSTIQMARHTHDDKDYPGQACTTTGLEFDAPEVV